VIIQEVQDLNIGAIGQFPGREIRLPGPVWLISFKADVAVSGTLFRLRELSLDARGNWVVGYDSSRLARQ
jgi:hypothetical protein